MTNQNFYRELVEPPLNDDLPPHTIKLLDDSTKILEKFGNEFSFSIDDLRTVDFSRLYHDLSDYYMELTENHPAAQRSSDESRVLYDLRAELDQSLASPARFREALARINSRLTGTEGIYRTGPMSLHPDRSGGAVVFPPASASQDQIERIRSIIITSTIENSLQNAVICSTILLNAHPFHDGNGRTSRLIFNYIISSILNKKLPYIPLFEVFQRCRGGYEIRLRIVETQANWNPLITFFCELIEVWHSALTRTDSPLRSEP